MTTETVTITERGLKIISQGEYVPTSEDIDDLHCAARLVEISVPGTGRVKHVFITPDERYEDETYSVTFKFSKGRQEDKTQQTALQE